MSYAPKIVKVGSKYYLDTGSQAYDTIEDARAALEAIVSSQRASKGRYIKTQVSRGFTSEVQESEPPVVTMTVAPETPIAQVHQAIEEEIKKKEQKRQVESSYSAADPILSQPSGNRSYFFRLFPYPKLIKCMRVLRDAVFGEELHKLLHPLI